jgi:hypothetical protein
MAKPNKSVSGSKKSGMSARQRKIRLQQIILAVIGIVVIISMVLALTMNY